MKGERRVVELVRSEGECELDNVCEFLSEDKGESEVATECEVRQ